MSHKIGVIGGSGVYNLDGMQIIQEHIVETPFGSPSDKIIEAKINGASCFFLPRHGRGHTILPHEVNYCANIFALKKLGIKYLISVSAVGSLIEDCPPKTFVLPDQFIDWTKGLRRRTFFGEGIVAHVSTAVPIARELQSLIYESCQKHDVKCSRGGAYLCIEGPQFSSKAESEIYRGFGAKVIGMTNVPEAYLAKEAGIAYATIAMVTDFDCWKEVHCSVEEIMKVMHINNHAVQEILKDVIPALNEKNIEYTQENQNAVMTTYEGLSAAQKEILDVLMG